MKRPDPRKVKHDTAWPKKWVYICKKCSEVNVRKQPDREIIPIYSKQPCEMVGCMTSAEYIFDYDKGVK